MTTTEGESIKKEKDLIFPDQGCIIYPTENENIILEVRMKDWVNEYSLIEDKLTDIQHRMNSCPRGSLRKRTIKGRSYYYLQYREGEHVRSHYIKADSVEDIRQKIENRKELEQEAQKLQARLNSYAKLLGIHRSYRPVKNVDYEGYTLFMSTVAHDYKNLGRDRFIDKYDITKLRGINKRYLAGFLDYINGIERQNTRRTNDLVLDPYTYLMYFKYGNKEALTEGIKHAIPAFLNRGLLITDVQEAVNGSFSK